MTYRIAHVERLPAAAWRALTDLSIMDNSGYQSSLKRIPMKRYRVVRAQMRDQQSRIKEHSFAAWSGTRLIGGSVAIEARPGVLFMQTSAVHPDFRRQGVYTAMVRHIVDWSREQGFYELTSKHHATNNPVLIAKLRLGFTIVGMELVPEWGPLVMLALPLDPGRADLYRFRAGAIAQLPELEE